MTRPLTLILLAALTATPLHAQRSSAPSIVPEPARVLTLKGSLRVSGAVFKCDPGIDSLSLEAIERFASRLSLASGKTSSVSTPIGLSSVVEDGSAKGLIFLKDKNMSPDEYSISVGRRAALVRAGGPEGFLYSVQTLKQMLPEAIYDGKPGVKEQWALPCCEISDRPKSAVRGLKIDSCDEFWSVEQILSFLDGMAKYKFNRLLWHIADGQAWRMEVRAYPLLAQAAGYRMQEGGRYGGYYSREDILRVVRHAEKLGISIIPDIRIEGRIIGDAELRPAGTRPEEFLRSILRETAEMFPFGYVSVTDEECGSTAEALASCGKAAAGEETLSFPEMRPEAEEIPRLGGIAENLWQ